jgi:peptidoglycan/xylan/chitin deacetylase (PgdA/CDA1 family)
MMGETIRYWIQSTNRQTDYYIAEIYLGNILIAKESQIKVQEGIAQDKKIITQIPETIEDLITISLYNNTTQKISKEDGKFSVQLENVKDKTVKTSDVTPRGDAFFSNIASGEYTLSVLKEGVLDTEWEITKISMIGEQKNFKIYRSISTNSTETPIFEKTIQSCNCVAFRFDDVQDYWLNKVQAEYVNVFVEEQIPLTVGIITDSFGRDPVITDTIKKSIKKDFIEVANHGVGNLPFTDFSKQKQREMISESINNLKNVLNVKSKIFIPPQNKFNNDTIDLLIESGFTHLSSSLIQGDVPPFPLENQTLYRFPQITTTGIYDVKESIFVGVNHEVTFLEAKQGLENYGFAVITSHPQEFSIVKDGTYTNEVNQQQINELKLLVQKIKSEGIKIVLISQININTDKMLIPDWIRNNAGWWAEGQIEDETFVQGLQYLIKEKIMKIPSTIQGTGSNSIPDWIRNNAGWWAEGQISDTDFVAGIQYLVTKGIITY